MTLRLLVDLLALRENARHISKDKISPVAAFSVGLDREIEQDDPSKAPTPDEANFHLQNKPRGIVDIAAVTRFDKQFAGSLSQVLNVSVTRDGRIGNIGRSDAVEKAALNGLLDHTRDQIGALADGILTGNISIRPYMLGGQSPCARCELQDVCRFDRGLGRYEHLESLDRQEMIERVSK